LSIQRKTRRSPQVPNPLSDENVNRILTACAQDPNKRDVGNIIRFMVNTGARASELKNLRWTNVDFPNSCFKVDGPKTPRQRSVPIGPETCQILKMYQGSESASEFVFGEARERLFIKASRQLHSVGKQVGVLPTSFHALRHTFAARFMTAGGDLFALFYILGLGWSSPSSTIKQFVRINSETVAREYARLKKFQESQIETSSWCNSLQ
jgi:integrase/recombinase XerD